MRDQYYVTMTDKAMSGWGKARGLTNKLIFVCDTMEEALTVEKNANNRNDMNYVNFCIAKPALFRKTRGSDYELNGCYVQIKTKEDYPTWYKKEG